MNIKLNTASIFRGENINREKIIVFDIEIDNIVCFKKSYIPSKNASIGNESKAELHAIHQALFKCNEEAIRDANIVIYYVKRNIFSQLYRDGIKDLSSIQSTQVINMFSKVKSNIEALVLRNCKVSFVEREDYKGDLISFADEELQRDDLTEPFDIINDYLQKSQDSNELVTDGEHSQSFYTESIKEYKKQLSSLDVLYDKPDLNKKDSGNIDKSSEYLALLSEELASIKNQCDIYDSEIVKIEKEIEETISLKEAAYAECEALVNEIEQLDKELSKHIQVIEDNIDSIEKVDQIIRLNEDSIIDKSKELKDLDEKVENIINDNLNMINYLRNEIEEAYVKKYFLSKMTDEKVMI